MTSKPKLFLDSTAIISAVISQNEASSTRRLVMLGEANALDLRISREVIGDTERFIRRHNPAMLPFMAEVITQGRIATAPDPSKETVDFCETLTGYRPDARILAAAVELAADILVTHDRTHILGNPKIVPPAVTVMVMNPKESLEWCYQHWMDSRIR